MLSLGPMLQVYLILLALLGNSCAGVPNNTLQVSSLSWGYIEHSPAKNNPGAPFSSYRFSIAVSLV